MTLSRRRFLTLAAAMLASPAAASPTRWQGRALGAEVRLTLHAPRREAERALRDIRALLARIERLFSLHDPDSQLSRLNATGRLDAPDPEFTVLLRRAGDMHAATDGRFDPSIQPLWQALARGGDAPAARALVGWHRVEVGPDRIALGRGQALTLNGIAQGHATDMATGLLRRQGFGRALVNIGEYAALGGPFRLGISDPGHGLVATTDLTGRAIATSSPGALALGTGQSHILDPQGKTPPRWSTVSVEADSAAVADAASTAFCLMDRTGIDATLPRLPGNARATLVSRQGTVATLPG